MIVLMLIYPFQLFAQDYSWWNEKHNWDGVTSWTRYIEVSPGYMGPNALTVPEIRNGTIFNEIYFEAAFDAHFSKGDNTQNIFTKFFYPFSKQKVAFEIQFIPWEHYKMTEETRDERKARGYTGEGTTIGDIVFGTIIQILKDRGKWPDILFSANFKTASGGGFDNARYIDAPGYYFDVSFGKSYNIGHLKQNSIRPYCLLGFYAWQTNRTDNFQNDAFLYGAGIDLELNKLYITNQVGGYSGYMGNKDEALVYRFKFIFEQRIINYKLEFQQGLHDFKYSTVRVSAMIKILRK
jgi:hypothetical protein